MIQGFKNIHMQSTLLDRTNFQLSIVWKFVHQNTIFKKTIFLCFRRIFRELEVELDMELVKKIKAKRDVFEGMKDILAIVDCPVCLDVIRDPPIYIYENSQGHSICSGCHRSLRNKRKPCPVCRKPLANRRSLGLEKLLELLPKTCRFEGCSQEAKDRAVMKKHEQDWNHRPVPFGWCDTKIGMKKLARHISKQVLLSS